VLNASKLPQINRQISTLVRFIWEGDFIDGLQDSQLLAYEDWRFIHLKPLFGIRVSRMSRVTRERADIRP